MCVGVIWFRFWLAMFVLSVVYGRFTCLCCWFGFGSLFVVGWVLVQVVRGCV